MATQRPPRLALRSLAPKEHAFAPVSVLGRGATAPAGISAATASVPRAAAASTAVRLTYLRAKPLEGSKESPDTVCGAIGSTIRSQNVQDKVFKMHAEPRESGMPGEVFKGRTVATFTA